MAEYLADPFCRGTQAGDARKLSLKACFPQVANLVQKHGSILAGMLRERAIPISKYDSPLVHQAKEERWRMWTLQNGMEVLVHTLYDQLTKQGVKIKLETECQEISFSTDNKVMVNIIIKLKQKRLILVR